MLARTAHHANPQTELGALEAHRAAAQGFVVEDTYWGYIVRSNARTPFLIAALQSLALVLGAALAIAAAGLWVLPGSIGAGELWGMKASVTVIALLPAALFLWYASRGTKSEIHVDTRLAEVREVVRNRAGRATVLSRNGFDIVDHVDIDTAGRRSVSNAAAALVIRDADTSAIVQVATGSVEALDRLRSRVGRDLMVLSPPARSDVYDATGAILRAA